MDVEGEKYNFHWAEGCVCSCSLRGGNVNEGGGESGDMGRDKREAEMGKQIWDEARKR